MPPTNWERIWMRLRASRLGADFPRERFIRTPIRVILQALEYIDNEEQRQHNLASSTAAKLCMQVIAIAHGFSGSKAPIKTKFEDFLPFPSWQPLDEEQAKAGPSPETRSLLGKLLRERRIPLPIYTQLISIDETSLD